MTTSIAEVVLQLDEISRRAEALCDENAALRAAISTIQDLHHIASGNGCHECLYPWPCPTITAISATR